VKVLREIERENVSSISIRNDPKAVVESVSHPSRGAPTNRWLVGPCRRRYIERGGGHGYESRGLTEPPPPTPKTLPDLRGSVVPAGLLTDSFLCYKRWQINDDK
jgi:hypothetical protein